VFTSVADSRDCAIKSFIDCNPQPADLFQSPELEILHIARRLTKKSSYLSALILPSFEMRFRRDSVSLKELEGSNNSATQRRIRCS
jgi:hypothetical protein